MTTSTPARLAYFVTPAAPHTSRVHVGQTVEVSHSEGATIHLAMSEAAAETLARLLFDYDRLTGTDTSHDERTSVETYDPALWTHVGLTLLTQRVIALDEIRRSTECVTARLVGDDTLRMVQEVTQ